jgi:hypothetical protein
MCPARHGFVGRLTITIVEMPITLCYNENASKRLWQQRFQYLTLSSSQVSFSKQKELTEIAEEVEAKSKSVFDSIV